MFSELYYLIKHLKLSSSCSVTLAQPSTRIYSLSGKHPGQMSWLTNGMNQAIKPGVSQQ